METKKNVNTEKTEIIETYVDFGFSQDSKYKQVYFVKPRLKDEPHFELTWKDGDKQYLSKTKKIEGKLTKIENSSYEYEGETINTLKFHIEWKNKEEEPILFILGSSFTGVLRSLINSMLNYNKSIDRISLSIYEKDGYASMFAMFNGEKTEWKYPWAEQQSMVIDIPHPVTGKVLQKDYSKLDEFLKDELFTHIDVLIPGHRVIVNEGSAQEFFDKTPEKKEVKEKKSKITSKEEEEMKKILENDDEDEFTKAFNEIN